MQYASTIILAIVLPWSGLSGFWAEMASAREPSKVTGHVWVRLTVAEKAAYITGVYDAGATRTPSGDVIDLRRPAQYNRAVTLASIDAFYEDTHSLDLEVVMLLVTEAVFNQLPAP